MFLSAQVAPADSTNLATVYTGYVSSVNFENPSFEISSDFGIRDERFDYLNFFKL